MATKFLLVLLLSTAASSMSTPPLTQVAPAGGVVVGEGGQAVASGSQQEEQSTAASEDQGFMQDIGFGQFFTDVGLQTSASTSEGLGAHPGQFAQAFAGVSANLAGPHFGVGVASSQQQPAAHGGKEDSAVKGFIPENPLSLGQYSSPSRSSPTSFVSSSSFAPFSSPFSPSPSSSPNHPAKPPSAVQPSGGFRPVHQASQVSHAPARHVTKPLRRPAYEKPSNPKYQELTPSQPEYHEPRPSHPEYEERRPHGEGSYSPKDEEYRREEEPQQTEDDYSYAPTHQEKRRPSHSYDDSEDHSYDSSRAAHGERRRPHYNDYDDHDEERGGHRHHRYSPRQDDRRSESRPAAHYRRDRAGGKGGKEDEGKCKEVEKDGMTCEVCKDDEGGYSEHCSHSTRSGKDSLYANSKRGGYKERGPDVYPPSQGRYEERGHESYPPPSHGRYDDENRAHVGRQSERSEARPGAVYVPRTPSSSSSSLGRSPSPYRKNSYQPHDGDPFEIQFSSPLITKTEAGRRIDVIYAPPSYTEDFGKEEEHDPFPKDSKYDPYSFSDVLPAESKYDSFDAPAVEFGHDDQDDYFGHVKGDDDDYFSRVKTDDFGSHGNDHDDNYGLDHHGKEDLKKSDSHKKPVYNEQERFDPLDHEDNISELSKIMKDFNKKDRASCKKVEKKGMTCYICQDPHGMEDEECLYSGSDPNGHQIMYMEETSY
ncbi:uncharacterized protein LOC122243274 isoform X2 [Penaeus japonicus]|uniref:uncharacterized protein LOC122243274 isoform X2 n=1 Tax=Penaeus japonicus TaxID=27405 RepID=UPI001C714C57|nr:uncharacterized protein LOC122243274 isoform X2 [Penaeus japonicus]